jgi:hypothetical protein
VDHTDGEAQQGAEEGVGARPAAPKVEPDPDHRTNIARPPVRLCTRYSAAGPAELANFVLRGWNSRWKQRKKLVSRRAIPEEGVGRVSKGNSGQCGEQACWLGRGWW